jgi:histidinol-phosphate phosphatase family protein
MLCLGQITDLHLRHHQPGSSALPVRRSRDMPAALRAALADLRARGAQAVVLTGDLLDVPDYVLHGEEAYDYQRSLWLEETAADYALVRRLLEDSGLPFLAVPGNHDAWTAFHRAFPEESLTVAGHRLLRFSDRQHGHQLLPQRIDAQRRAFLAALADASLPQVHCQHYVLTPELNQGYPHTYWEHAELCRRLAAAPHVRLALSGHYHAGTALLRVGATTVTTAPAFTEAPHRYRLYELDSSEVRAQDLALPAPAARPAVFIDRDGVITVDASYRTGPEALRLLPGAATALARLRQAGFATVVVTNQSCVGMGFVTRELLAATHDRLCRLLRDGAGDGAQPDAIHASLGAGAEAVHPDLIAEDDAKPAPVLVERARAQLGLAPGGWFIGDRPGDLACARNSGCIPMLVRTGDGALTAAGLGADAGDVRHCDDLAAAVDLILAG